MLQPFIYDCIIDTVPYNVEVGMIDISIFRNATIFCVYLIFADSLSGNHTAGSRCNSLVRQARPSKSYQVLTLTLWIPGQTLTAATSTASFVQNPSVLRWLVYGPFIDACFT